MTETVAAYRRTLTPYLRPLSSPEPVGSVSVGAVVEEGHDPSTRGSTVWEQALQIDRAHRMATNRPASVWRLRTALHLGPARARRLYEELHQHHCQHRESAPPE
ncbi:hypothetical protein [Streptomyces sp. AJS327]|uniref:hypothetical protein n=1 Tax=Streptomyces sp. AJS327 TaxID=2545265 RepID=UPI0021556B05|nr:hypothetical protein [Streptomyces sp. AJS327]